MYNLLRVYVYNRSLGSASIFILQNVYQYWLINCEAMSISEYHRFALRSRITRT